MFITVRTVSVKLCCSNVFCLFLTVFVLLPCYCLVCYYLEFKNNLCRLKCLKIGLKTKYFSYYITEKNTHIAKQYKNLFTRIYLTIKNVVLDCYCALLMFVNINTSCDMS